MKVSKAIEILNAVEKRLAGIWFEDDQDAIKLGIEALKRVALHRTDRRYPFNTPLPGETPEDE